MPALSNDDLSDARSWNAPAAMYFVISVFPISMTSGVLPPASVASNLPRCVPQVWYCTFTVTPGCCFWNAAFAAATTAGHPDCASTWSQTVMLAVDRFVAPVGRRRGHSEDRDEHGSADDACLHRRSPILEGRPSPAPVSRVTGGEDVRLGRRIGSDHLVTARDSHRSWVLVKTTLQIVSLRMAQR